MGTVYAFLWKGHIISEEGSRFRGILSPASETHEILMANDTCKNKAKLNSTSFLNKLIISCIFCKHWETRLSLRP